MVVLDRDSFSQVDTGKFLFFGTLFTVAVDAALYPLELVKTRVQVESASRATVFDATLRVGRDVFRREGVAGLYKGFFFFTLGGLPSQGAYFYGYNWARERLGEANGARPPEQRYPLYALDMAAGLFADVAASPLWTPTEVISTRLQIQGPGVVAHTGAWDAARTIYTQEGIRGLFRGLTASIMVFGPASALWWATYQACNRHLTARWATARPAAGQGGREAASEHKMWVDGLSGFVAGSISSIVTNPLDVAKTRLQAQHGLLEDFQLEDSSSSGSGRGASRVRGKPAVQSAAAAAAAAASAAAPPAAALPAAGTDRLSRARQRLEAEKQHVWGKNGCAGTRTTPSAALASPFFTRLRARALLAPPSAAAAAAAASASSAAAAASASAAAAASPVAAAAAAASAAATQLAAATALFPALLTGPPFRTALASSPASMAAATARTLAEISASERRLAQRAASAGSSLPHGGGGRGGGGVQLHKGMVSMLLHIVAKDGPGALIRGLLPRLLMQGPASAATFVCYEQVLQLSRKEGGEGVE